MYLLCQQMHHHRCDTVLHIFISLGRGKLKVKETFIATVDELSDIPNRKYNIKLCSVFEGSCPVGVDCKYGMHIFCSFSKDRKIPIKELIFNNSQREKAVQHQIGLLDLPEHRKQIKEK